MKDFNYKIWIQEIQEKITAEFKNRVVFVGYQGSYRRNEAGKDSDIDMVIILDKLKFEDLITYKKIVKSMPFSEKSMRIYLRRFGN